jgi:hypothetical protein
MTENYLTLENKLGLVSGKNMYNLSKVFEYYGEVSEENYDLDDMQHSVETNKCVCSKDINMVYRVYSRKHNCYLTFGSRCINRFNKKNINKQLNQAKIRYNKKTHPEIYCCICDSDRKLPNSVIEEQIDLKKRYHKKCNPYEKKICSVEGCHNFIRGFESWKKKCLKCYYGNRYYK